jgi:hypothetical protein
MFGHSFNLADRFTVSPALNALFLGICRAVGIPGTLPQFPPGASAPSTVIARCMSQIGCMMRARGDIN